GGDGGVQRLARIGSRRTAALGDRDADAPRDFAHRRRIIHAELLHEEGVDVTGLVADEAVEHPFPGNHGEVAMRAAVKGTAASVICPGPLELHGLANDSHEVRCFAHLLDHVVGNHVSRSRSSGAITNLTEPISTTARPSERISATTPTLPAPVLTRSPILRSIAPTVRPSGRPAVFSIASSTIRR